MGVNQEFLMNLWPAPHRLIDPPADEPRRTSKEEPIGCREVVAYGTWPLDFSGRFFPFFHLRQGFRCRAGPGGT